MSHELGGQPNKVQGESKGAKGRSGQVVLGGKTRMTRRVLVWCESWVRVA
ncbi:hypothetical protein shim_23410 [Shimia sp. SK013]|nr:hypothetical protein shim_23410 [Shimia sp. SK013]